MAQKTPPPVYEREKLLQSRRFSQVQPDFLRAVLQKERYAIEEAEAAVQAFFGKGAK